MFLLEICPFRRGAVAAALSVSLFSISARADALPPDTVVVTAERVADQAALSGSSVSVLTGATLDTEQYTMVADALRTLPGTIANDTGGPGGVTSVMLRGLDGKNVKVLIDGIDVANPAATAAQFDFANLLADDIGRIEVVRGPQSTLYGSDAMGGVINIFTKNGRDDPGGTVSIAGGSYGTVEGTAALRGVTGPVDYSAAISGVNTDGIVSADRKNGNSQHDPYANLSASLKLGIALGDQFNLGGVFRYVQADHDYPGFSFVTSLPADDPGQSQSTREIFARVQLAGRFWDGRVENLLAVDATDTHSDFLQFDVSQNYYDGKSDAVEDQVTVNLASDYRLVAGGETRAEHYHDDTGLKADQRTDGFYGELVAHPLQSLSVTAGVRNDQVEGGAGATTYRLTSTFQPIEEGPRLHASFGTGFKAPSLYQLFVVSPYVLGDRGLKPEKSEGWDAGATAAVPFWNTEIDVTGFANDIRDLISGFTDDNFVFHYANVGHARTDGIETTLTSHPTSAVDLSVAYTWLRTEDLTGGGELPRRPHHDISGTALWRPLDNVETFVGISWEGARNDLDFSPGDPPIVRLAPYALVRLGGAWRVAPELKLFVRLENALNRHYEQVFGYGEPGRAAYAGITASF